VSFTGVTMACRLSQAPRERGVRRLVARSEPRVVQGDRWLGHCQLVGQVLVTFDEPMVQPAINGITKLNEDLALRFGPDTLDQQDAEIERPPAGRRAATASVRLC
jgi:hypothetical protein